MQRGSLQLQWTDRTTPLGKHIEVMHRQRPPSKAPFAPQMFGNAAREHMERYGTTKEQLAKIAYKNHKHSVNNPYAQFCEEYSLEQILNSPMVYEPLTKLQCCPTSEGAAAAILASEAFVKQHNLEHQAVEIIGMAMATDTEATFKGSMIDMVGFEMSALAAQKAYRQAGVSIKDIQLIELHDCFSSNELITYEALGLCGRGEGGKLVDRGEVTYGGKWVVNPSGGLISKGHPLGATGLAQCAELCWQLRGMAGKRQVANAKVALQHNIGLGGAAVVAIYRLGFPDKFRPYPPNKPNPAVDPNAFRIPSPSPSKRTTEAVGDLKCAKVFADLKQKIAANPGFVQRIGAVYQFDVKTLGGTTVSWTVDLKNGVGDVKEGVSGSAECILTATDEDLAQIMTGKLDAVTAFASGRLKISGNMKQVMKLGELLKAPSKI
jgi:sterol carrier protein 2